MTVEITYKDVLLEVEGIYTEAEDRVMYYGDLDGHPGSPASFDIEDVLVEGVSIINLLSENDLLEIETLVLEEICG